MKTLPSLFLVAFVPIAVSISAGYSLNMTARVHELDRRLQSAEALLQSYDQPQAGNMIESRIGSLEQKVQRAELAASRVSSVTDNANPGLEQRFRSFEQKIQPHLEALPSYEPAR
jgi:hypothetical protein